jgi:hypothetical protein
MNIININIVKNIRLQLKCRHNIQRSIFLIIIDNIIIYINFFTIDNILQIFYYFLQSSINHFNSF